MSQHYRGNTAAKDGSRIWIYGGVLNTDTECRKHIVIGGDCDDIKFLLERGISPLDIIACDRDGLAVEKARDLGVVVPPEYEASHDIVRCVKWAVKEYGAGALRSINIDLMGTLAKVIGIAASIKRLAINPATQITLTFFSAHDPGFGLDQFETNTPGAKRKQFLEAKLQVRLYDGDYYPYNSGSPMVVAKIQTSKLRIGVLRKPIDVPTKRVSIIRDVKPAMPSQQQMCARLKSWMSANSKANAEMADLLEIDRKRPQHSRTAVISQLRCCHQTGKRWDEALWTKFIKIESRR